MKKIYEENSKRINTSLSLPFFFKEFNHIKNDELLNIGHKTLPYLRGLLILADTTSSTLFLFSDGSFDCNAIIKSLAGEFHGKGGGNKTSSRIKFENYEIAETFLKALLAQLK